MARTRSRRLCAFCGGVSNSRDHIPSRKFFPEPRPDNLITVPACTRCNNEISADEEYFLLRVLANDGAITPEASAVNEERFAGIITPRRARALVRLRDEMKWVPRLSPAGIIIGKDLEYPIDGAIVERVIRKIIRGLYFHEFGVPVPDTHEVVVASYFTRNPEVFDNPVGRVLLANRIEARGHTVFQYRKQVMSDSAASAVFMIEFFQGVPAIGAVLTKQGAAALKKKSPK